MATQQLCTTLIGTHSRQMMRLTYDLWNWNLERKILLSVEHLPGKLNQVESSMYSDSSEWKLKPLVFRQLMEQMGPCQIDLLASHLTTQLEVYMSRRPELRSSDNGCIVPVMEPAHRICLPTILLNWKMPEQSALVRESPS